MCENCGCMMNPDTKSAPFHSHSHPHQYTHSYNTKIKIAADVMAKNDTHAEQNRALFTESNLFVLNIISSPGSGKTTLIQALANEFRDAMAVIVGDCQTHRDAERIIGSGSRAYQIETEGACHLDAHSIAHALEQLDLVDVKLLVIENVGNLVCPATYDLGENLKIAILSTPEGDDKILKYPSIFSRISTLLINKIDLLPHLEFNTDKVVNECKSLNKKFDVFSVSATSGEGLDGFFDYLRDKIS